MKDLYVDVDGISIRYFDSQGDGIPVLLSHGIGGSLELWQKQLKSLGDQFRLIAWDCPGHGLSAMGDQPYDFDKFARFAWRFADAIGVSRMVLAGNSMGGAVSIRMAALEPERCAGLFLANSAGLKSDVCVPFRVMTLPFLGELMMKPGEASVQRQIDAIVFDKGAISTELRGIIARNEGKPLGGKAMLDTLRATGNWRGIKQQVIDHSLATLKQVSCPVVFLHGRQDAVLPVSHSEQAHAQTPGSQLVIWDQCGHTPQLEKPADFNKLLGEFVTSCR